jgi:EAL domain-containing protein (putative c-di-GMP-specific phosphodiesterase class I)/GGDEF domain-containing protein
MRLSVRTHVAMLVVIAIIFLGAGRLIRLQIQDFYYRQMEAESQRLATSYAYNLEQALESTGIINRLLNEKIHASGLAVLAHQGRLNNQVLAALARSTGVDLITFFSKDGGITHSSTGEFIGMVPPKDNPIYEFIQSSERSRVDPIRKSLRDGKYYKFGYVRLEDGRFAQIGVRAERIQHLMGRFEVQELLEHIRAEYHVAEARFVPQDQVHRAGTSDSQDGEVALAGYNMQVFLTPNGQKLFRFEVPIALKGESIGRLVLGHDLTRTDELVDYVSNVWIVALVLIYLMIAVMIYSGYQRNRILSHYAYFDMVSGMRNRRYFAECVADDLARNEKAPRAVVVANLANFKMLNASYGCQYGERLVQLILARLSKLCLSSCRLFHLSVDRFAFYVRDYANREELVGMGEKVLGLLKDELSAQPVGGNVGIVEIQGGGYRNPDEILRNAFIAIDQASKRGRFGYCFFDRSMEEAVSREDQIERELRQALEDPEQSQVFLVFQPKVDLRDDRIVGFEALARLKSEVLGSVSPMEFVEVAEKKMLIVPLSNLILRMAGRFARTLEVHGLAGGKVAVNISGLQLLRDDFTDTVLQLVGESGAPASRIELEITESVFFNDYELVNGRLRRLRENGIDIMLDDFGVGYSSLSRVQDLCIDAVKIDKSFVDRILCEEKEGIVIPDIISMAHRLRYKVVAEGVETAEQKDYLLQAGCDVIQGFLYSKPLSEMEALKLLQWGGILHPQAAPSS